MRKKNLRFRLGSEIKRLRQAQGWTQAELAKRSRVSRSYIQRIESETPPDMTLDVLAKLAKGFGLDCHRLVKRACMNRR